MTQLIVVLDLPGLAQDVLDEQAMAIGPTANNRGDILRGQKGPGYWLTRLYESMLAQ